MLESEAKWKLCPLSMGAGPGPSCCYGSKCMAWEATTIPVHEDVPFKDGQSGTWRKYVGRAPKDPPEGFCGMVPPDSQCGYPG